MKHFVTLLLDSGRFLSPIVHLKIIFSIVIISAAQRKIKVLAGFEWFRNRLTLGSIISGIQVNLLLKKVQTINMPDAV